MTIYAVKAIGKELALDLFNQCKEIERSGGMLVNNQKRRRTPGGVFLQLLKTSPKISDQIKVTYKVLLWEDNKFKKVVGVLGILFFGLR